MANARIGVILERYKKLKSKKQNLKGLYDLISEYVYNRKFDGGGVPNSGIFTKEDIFDNSAQRANAIMANVMVNNIWPNGPRTFSINRTWDTRDTQENKAWFEHVNQQMYSVMDSPRAGLQTALDEYMLDQGAFGISGVYVEEKEDDELVPVRFKPWNVKACMLMRGPTELSTQFLQKWKSQLETLLKFMV